MPTRIHFPGTTYSRNKAAIKASFPRTCKWDRKGRRGWFGEDLNITAHLRSGEPGTLYLEGKQDCIDAVVEACSTIVDSCQVDVVDEVPQFQPFAISAAKQGSIDLTPAGSLRAVIRNERLRLQAAGMSEEFSRKWIAIIENEYLTKSKGEGDEQSPV